MKARLLLLALLVPVQYACEGACRTDFDCGEEAYCDTAGHYCRTDCFIDSDCEMALGCELMDDGCAMLGRTCTDGRCSGGDALIGGKPVGLDDDGAQAAPGTGLVFVIDALTIGAPHIGFDVDGQCDPECIDNTLATLGPHANESLNTGVRTSGNLLLVEIAGLTSKYAGRDDAVTLKVYGGVDADAIIANNFDGQGTVLIDREAITTDNRARTAVPAKIIDHRLVTKATFDLAIPLSFHATVRPTVEFARMRMSFLLAPNLRTFSDGVLGGALPARALHRIENPFCGQLGVLCSTTFSDSTLLDMVVRLISNRPDVDLDGDGAECVLDRDGDETIDACCDDLARGDACSDPCARTLTPTDPDDASTCALNADLADGYSVGLQVGGIVVDVVGLGG